MDRDTFVQWAGGGGLTPKQAEAFYRRHVAGESRGDAADAMETSGSNLDNHERAAREKIRRASNLLALLEGVDYQHDGEIGTCSVCDNPARALAPDPRDDAPLDERAMVCPGCLATIE